MSSEESESKISLILEFIVVRIVYFIGCFFCLTVGAGILLDGGFRHGTFATAFTPRGLVKYSMPEFWIGVTVLSFIGALVGPILYHRHTMRGRGSLKDIKEDGWYDGE